MEITKDTPAPTGARAVIHTDGSCPANPGPMGIGFTIEFDDAHENEHPLAFGYRLGEGTNNRAEYLAVIAALREALRQGVTDVEVRCDSQLVVMQIRGQWAVKDGSLKPLHAEAEGLAALFTRFEINHIPREDNSEADHYSRTPTDPHLPPPTVEIDLNTPVRRKLTRQQAAMVRWWWKTRRCQNEYRLARIFGGTPSHFGRIGRGEQYKDITAADLPGFIRQYREDINYALGGHK